MSAKANIEKKLREIGSPKDGDREKSLTRQWDEYLEDFSKDIENYFLDNRQDEEEFQTKLDILKEIEKYLAKNIFDKPIGGIEYEIKAVVPFGSSPTGLGMTEGDLDMVVCVHPALPKHREVEIKTRTNQILATIFKKIQSGKMLGDRETEDMEHRDGARVPIITGVVDDVELDISISMTDLVSEQYLATKIIDAYERYDRRFILLAAYVKKWMKSKKTDENEDYYRTVFPNSCTNVLLVIFFMKQCGLLPNVNEKHEDQFDMARQTWAKVNGWEYGSYGVRRLDVANWKESNKCEVGLGTLFLLFLDFYAKMGFRHNKICIGKGKLLEKGEEYEGSHIMIEDVYDKESKATPVTQLAMYKKYLQDARRIVRHTDPEEIDEELMEGSLPDVGSFTNAELMKLKRQGLHTGPKPKKYSKK